MVPLFPVTRRIYCQSTKHGKTAGFCSLRVLCALVLMTGMLLFLTTCGPASQPTATPEPTSTAVPTPEPTETAAPVFTPTPLEPQVGAVEGLVMEDNGQLIVGVNWTSKSRITYVVQGNDLSTIVRFLGETARVTGVIVDRGQWLKEIQVRTAEASTATDRLSWRSGFIAELGASVYMQGTHLLGDREGKVICLLDARESGLGLDSYMSKGQVRVTGIMTKTIEGNALIMEVKLVEKIE